MSTVATSLKPLHSKTGAVNYGYIDIVFEHDKQLILRKDIRFIKKTQIYYDNLALCFTSFEFAFQVDCLIQPCHSNSNEFRNIEPDLLLTRTNSFSIHFT